MILTGETRRTWRKTYPSATLSATNSKWIDLGANPVLRVKRPATNRLNHGMAQRRRYLIVIVTDRFLSILLQLTIFNIWNLCRKWRQCFSIYLQVHVTTIKILHLISILPVEPKLFTPLTKKPETSHGPEPVPCTSNPQPIYWSAKLV
jgi:hypothetical protein